MMDGGGTMDYFWPESSWVEGVVFGSLKALAEGLRLVWVQLVDLVITYWIRRRTRYKAQNLMRFEQECMSKPRYLPAL